MDLRTRKKVFFTIAFYAEEYEKNINPTDTFLSELTSKGVDVFTFVERSWCCPISNPPTYWKKTKDNVGMLEIKDFKTWWNSIGKKTRNMIRKAEKSGITVAVMKPDKKLIDGVWKIYNETPIRQGNVFSHYGQSLKSVAWNVHRFEKDSVFIVASTEDQIVGFIQIVNGDNINIISQILSMQKYWNRAVNNALLAKAVEVCASEGERWLMYGRIGNHPSLDKFKESNGFVKFPTNRYYVPITWMGSVAVRLGLHKEFQDVLPQWLKNGLPQWLKSRLITGSKLREMKKTRLKDRLENN